MKNELLLYQSEKGEIKFRGDLQKETIWASLQQIADLFETDKSGISRHIKNIYESSELDPQATVAKNATVQVEGKRKVKREIEYYNLDLILSVGYRVNSKTATKFRQWATNTLREYITKGYVINKNQIAKNYQEYLVAVDSVKNLLPTENKIKADDALELVKLFAGTWLSLDAYDQSSLPKYGVSKKQVSVNVEELTRAIGKLKHHLITTGKSSDLFAQEKTAGAIAGIVGNVFQSVLGEDAYKTVEEKAAHLLYFMVKNHPFTDGNKRSGAFAFVWFLQKARLLNKDKISPEALTALTLLVAESNPKDKERVIGLILHLLKA